MDPDPNARSYGTTTYGAAHNETEQAQIQGVTFEDQVDGTRSALEYCHNLMSQVHPNPKNDVEYDTSRAMLIARTIDDLTKKVMIQEAP
jgi:hypothetical protein